MVSSESRSGDFVYDVALSFAGEQRAYVQEVAAALRSRGLRPFYDDYEKAVLWGKDLYEHLDWVYQEAAQYCVLFASEDYANKVWTTHERRSAQARALRANQEYVLPVRFDGTEIPGLRSTVMFVDARSLSPEQLAELISQKLGPRVHKNFFPPEPDKLFSTLDVTSPDERQAVESIGVSFMKTLMRMTVDERRLVAYAFTGCCPVDLPEQIHINLDIARRDLGVPPTALVERMRAMTSLGFEVEIGADEHYGDGVLVIRWLDLTAYDDDFTFNFATERSTEVAVGMFEVPSGDCCEQCTERYVENLDFSLLASSTREPRIPEVSA